MTKKRGILVAVVLMLVIGNFLIFRMHRETEAIPIYEGDKWLVYMPELEASQALDNDLLYSSHSLDPRVPVSSTINPSFSKTSMYSDILECRPNGIVVDRLRLAPLNEIAQQMPPRFIVWTSGNDAPSCIEDILPIGYTIKKYKNNAKKN